MQRLLTFFGRVPGGAMAGSPSLPGHTWRQVLSGAGRRGITPNDDATQRHGGPISRLQRLAPAAGIASAGVGIGDVSALDAHAHALMSPAFEMVGGGAIGLLLGALVAWLVPGKKPGT